MPHPLDRLKLTALAAGILGAASLGGLALTQPATPNPRTTPATPPAASTPPAGDTPAEPAPRAAEAPKVLALALYADWCPACKTLKPKMEEAMKSFSGQPVLMVRLDQTQKDSRQAEYMLHALGLADLWKNHGGKTGYVLLVNAETKKIVGNISFRFEAKEITEALTKAVKDATK